MKTHSVFIAGKWQTSEEKKEVLSPLTHEKVAEVFQANSVQLNTAIEASVKAFESFRNVGRYLKSKLLLEMAKAIDLRRGEFAKLMVEEAGKPITLAEGEINRALTTFTVASEEAKRYGGEVLPLDIDAASAAFQPAIIYWVPKGVVLGITPFNFPLNLVAHKLAPGLACGAPVIIKAAPQTPGCANLLAKIFEEVLAAHADLKAAIPASVFQVIHCSNEVASEAVRDKRISVFSFTGSAEVGWKLQGQAVGKRVALELGGNAGVIVCADSDIKRAAARCVFGGFSYAGQSCISVQKIFVEKNCAREFEELLVQEAKKVVFGDPAKKDTFVGPLINKGACDRVYEWIEEAKKKGAKVLQGGKRSGNILEPTVLANVPSDVRISCEEVFGPVILVESVSSYEEAISKINNSRYGLQAGIFTDSARKIQNAIRLLEVGGVTVNEVPTYRADHMPYGGVKDSGLGREGLRYAMEEYSERKTVITFGIQ